MTFFFSFRTPLQILKVYEEEIIECETNMNLSHCFMGSKKYSNINNLGCKTFLNNSDLYPLNFVTVTVY